MVQILGVFTFNDVQTPSGSGYKTGRKHAHFNQPKTKTLSEILLLELMRMASYLFCDFVTHHVRSTKEGDVFSRVCPFVRRIAYSVTLCDWLGR